MSCPRRCPAMPLPCEQGTSQSCKCGASTTDMVKMRNSAASRADCRLYGHMHGSLRHTWKIQNSACELGLPVGSAMSGVGCGTNWAPAAPAKSGRRKKAFLLCGLIQEKYAAPVASCSSKGAADYRHGGTQKTWGSPANCKLICSLSTAIVRHTTMAW